jgi:hypothetical protein
MKMLLEYVEEDGNITATIEINEPAEPFTDKMVDWNKYGQPSFPNQPQVTWSSTSTGMDDDTLMKLIKYHGNSH